MYFGFFFVVIEYYGIVCIVLYVYIMIECEEEFLMYLIDRIFLLSNSLENSIWCFLKVFYDDIKKYYGVCYCFILVKGCGKCCVEWG